MVITTIAGSCPSIELETEATSHRHIHLIPQGNSVHIILGHSIPNMPSKNGWKSTLPFPVGI